jgi:hypothetical protein
MTVFGHYNNSPHSCFNNEWVHGSTCRLGREVAYREELRKRRRQPGEGLGIDWPHLLEGTGSAKTKEGGHCKLLQPLCQILVGTMKVFIGMSPLLQPL